MEVYLSNILSSCLFLMGCLRRGTRCGLSHQPAPSASLPFYLKVPICSNCAWLRSPYTTTPTPPVTAISLVRDSLGCRHCSRTCCRPMPPLPCSWQGALIPYWTTVSLHPMNQHTSYRTPRSRLLHLWRTSTWALRISLGLPYPIGSSWVTCPRIQAQSVLWVCSRLRCLRHHLLCRCHWRFY